MRFRTSKLVESQPELELGQTLFNEHELSYLSVPTTSLPR